MSLKGRLWERMSTWLKGFLEEEEEEEAVKIDASDEGE